MPSKVYENLKSIRQCWRRRTLSLFYRKGDGIPIDPSMVLLTSFGTMAFLMVNSDTHGLYMEGRCLPNTVLEPLQRFTHPAAGLMQVGCVTTPWERRHLHFILALTCFGEFWNGHMCGKQCSTRFTGKTIYSSNSP